MLQAIGINRIGTAWVCLGIEGAQKTPKMNTMPSPPVATWLHEFYGCANKAMELGGVHGQLMPRAG